MPIKAENRARYPANWLEIRARIQSRANNKCEECGVPNRAWGYRVAGIFHRVNKRQTIEAVRSGREWVRPPFWLGEHRIIEIVCTTAHLGRPAHLPVHLRMAPSTQTDQIVELVCFVLPLDAELSKWRYMMHDRALTEFSRGFAAASARFLIALPCGGSSLIPGSAVSHLPAPMPPQWISLTDWRLLREPWQSASIGTETSFGPQVVAADLVDLPACLTDSLAEPTFRQAHCFVATGRRTRFDEIRSLLGGDREGRAAHHANGADRAPTNSASDAGTLNPTTYFSGVFQTAFSGTRLSTTAGLMGEIRAAGNTGNSERTFSRSGHDGILLHCEEYPENCSDDNLRFWCQKCHLRYDHAHHQANARATRRAGKAIEMDL